VGLAIGIAFLLGFIFYVGVDALVAVLLRVNPAVIAAMVVIQTFGFVFYSAAWDLLIRGAGYQLRFRTCLGITFASIFAAYTTPSGIFMEALRCVLGSKETGMSLGGSTATVIFHRILYVIGFLVSTGLAIMALLASGYISRSTVTELAGIPVIAIIGLVVSLYLSFNPKRLQPLFDRILRFLKPLIRIVRKEAELEGKSDLFLGDFHKSFRKMISSRWHMFASFLASIGDWSCSVLILWAVLVGLGVSLPIWAVVVTMALGRMIQMTPIAVPGMLGIYEAAITTALTLFAVPVAVAASAALLSRIVTTWMELPITGVAAYHYGVKMISGRFGSTVTT